MTPYAFRKLFDGKTMERRLYCLNTREETVQYSGIIECHSTYYLFRFEDEAGQLRASRGDCRNLIPDDDGKGFRIPFVAPFDGWNGFHYIMKEEGDA